MNESFKNVAPLLANPIILVSYALFVLGAFYQALIFSGVIPPLTTADAGPIVAALINNLFWASILVIILGSRTAF
jgi:hypothetical protein